VGLGEEGDRAVEEVVPQLLLERVRELGIDGACEAA